MAISKKEIQAEIMDVENEDIVTDSPEDIQEINNPPVKQSQHYFMSTNTRGPYRMKQQGKQEQLDKVLTDKLGPDLRKVLDKLIMISMYDPDQKILVKNKDGVEELRRRINHFYNSNTQMQAITLLLKYYYGNPRKEIQIDQNVDVKIEKKVADLTKLINDNSDRLKLVKG